MIHNILSDQRRCTATSLAQRCEVSDRTIRRMIEFMRNQLGAPIEWEPSTKTYFYSRPYDKLSHVSLNSQEALALLLVEQTLKPLKGLPIANALRTILEKISQTVGNDVRHSWESLAEAIRTPPSSSAQARECQHFRSILDAIQRHRVLAIDYQKPGAHACTARRVHPLHLVEREHQWTLVAFDPEASGIRKFLLARMDSCNIEPENFSPPPHFNIDDYLKGSMGLFTGDHIHDVVIDFSPYAARYLREAAWHPSQQLTELPNGEVRASFRLNNLIDIQRSVLSWGEHATVREPPELREAFARVTQHFEKSYSSPEPRTSPDRGDPL